MKLELKHLVGYLPYGLKIMTDYDGIQEIQGMPDLFHVNYYDNESDNGDEPHIEDIKPILHPLSDLTKEIEVNGEKFVPLTEICNCEYYGYSELRSMVQNNNFYLINALQYQSIEKILEWHFDIYGLIENNLAIDKKTIS